MMRPRGLRGFFSFSRLLGGDATPVQSPAAKYRVAIIGGGSAGVSVASQLMKKLPQSLHSEIAIIEPSDKHFYQPYWTMVGGLGLDKEKSVLPMSKVIPAGVSWVKEGCATFEPDSNSISLKGGGKLEYDVLVVTAGLQQNFGLVPGLMDTLGKNGVSSIYSYEYSSKVWENIEATKQGKAIFTNPGTAVNCGGAPQKIAYLADCAWRQKGVREKIEIDFCTATPGIFACPTYRAALEKIMAEKSITPHVKTNLVEVDGPGKVAIFEKEGGERVKKEFDFLHVTPPMSAPDFIKNSPLANGIGFVDVDKETCQHTQFSNVFSLGDCSSLPTSKTYSAISSQAPVVVHNVLAMLDSKPQNATAAYDGYTACPVLVGGNKLMLAEFNGYTMDAMPTFVPLDQAKPNTLFYIMKRWIFEQVYWHFMPVGLWYGKRMFFEPPVKHKVVATAATSNA